MLGDPIVKDGNDPEKLLELVTYVQKYMNRVNPIQPWDKAETCEIRILLVKDADGENLSVSYPMIIYRDKNEDEIK